MSEPSNGGQALLFSPVAECKNPACGHTWILRNLNTLPQRCPKCQTRRWKDYPITVTTHILPAQEAEAACTSKNSDNSNSCSSESEPQ